MALLTGCAQAPAIKLPDRLNLPVRPTTAVEAAEAAPKKHDPTPMPAPPDLTPTAQRQPTPIIVPDEPETSGSIDINFEQVPLTSLIQTVYTEILGRPVSIDAKVMERRDLVTFRTPAKMTRAQVREAMALLLKSYGVAAVDTGGLVRVVPDNMQVGYLPEIRRGAALPETPQSLRPVFQLVELTAVRQTEVAGWLKQLFKERIQVQEDPTRNALLLSGNAENVAAALEAIRVLDQPTMRGRASVRVTPTYWAAEELAKRLAEVLAAEGYTMPPANYSPLSGGVRYPILILPLVESNSLLIFTLSDKHLAHVLAWVEKLDQPRERDGGKGFLTYTARNVSAEDLARTLAQLFDGAASSQPASGTAGSASGAAATSMRLAAGRVVVDRTSNTLIFRTSPEDYSHLITLLRTLDKPPKAALVEVTVAELVLSDDSQFGIEWLLKDLESSGAGVTAGTLGGLGIGNTGLTVKRLVSGGETRLILNALAASNRANVLSSPRVVARNGETATIQVGQEVPVITSQQSTLSATSPTGTGVLQTVQYRNTGVILRVKPTIHSGDRIDLEVQQEVSAAQATVTGVNNSPTISTRKIDTKMTLQSGSTVILGGLISDSDSGGDAGVPLLKDIPLIGRLFGVQTKKKTKTELVVLITPYVLNDEGDARAVTESFRALLPWLGEDKKHDSRARQDSPSGST